MAYEFEEEEEREHQGDRSESLEKKDIREEFEEAIAVDEDEKDFLNFSRKISKWEKEMVVLSGEFHDDEISAYEAKSKMMVLLDLMADMRDELRKTL